MIRESGHEKLRVKFFDHQRCSAALEIYTHGPETLTMAATIAEQQVQQGVTTEVQPDGKWLLADSNSCLSRSVLHTTQKEQIVTRTSARNLPLWVKQGASFLSINCLILRPCIIPLPAHLRRSDPKKQETATIVPRAAGAGTS